VHKLAKDMLYEWKILVYMGKMTVKEYDARRAAIDEFFARMDMRAPRPPGWEPLRKRMQKKFPDMIVPEHIRERCYRGNNTKQKD